MTREFPWIRNAQTLLEMVGALHRDGYEQLRIMPYEYPLAWRLFIGPRAVFTMANGAFAHHGGDYPALYSSASEDRYFGWTDARDDGADDLASKFAGRFSEVASAGHGADITYANWFERLLERTRRTGELPFVMAEYFEPGPFELDFLPLRNYVSGEDGRFELPPPGSAEEVR